MTGQTEGPPGRPFFFATSGTQIRTENVTDVTATPGKNARESTFSFRLELAPKTYDRPGLSTIREQDPAPAASRPGHSPETSWSGAVPVRPGAG